MIPYPKLIKPLYNEYSQYKIGYITDHTRKVHFKTTGL